MRKLRLHQEPLIELGVEEMADLAGGVVTTKCLTGDYTATIHTIADLPTKNGCPFTGDPCLSTLPVAALTKVGCS